MTHTYKVGDKVRITGKSRRHGYDYIGKHGSVTYVSGRRDTAGKLWVNVDVHGLKAKVERTFHLDAIEPLVVCTLPKCSCIVVLRDELGKVAPSKSPVEHQSLDEAIKEAERLAAKYQGQFEVWQQAAVARKPAPPKPTLFKQGDFVRATQDTCCEVYGTKVAKGQVVRVTYIGHSAFNSSPLPGNFMPCLTTSHFESVPVTT